MTNPPKKQMILERWTELKESLISTLNHLKARTNPAVLALESQILAKIEEIKTKQKEIYQLPLARESSRIGGEESTSTPTSEAPSNQQFQLISQQIDQLEREQNSLFDQLQEINPFLVSLSSKLSAKDEQINNLTKMVTENQNVTLQHSNQKYEAQLQALHLNYEAALKKLIKSGI